MIKKELTLKNLLMKGRKNYGKQDYKKGNF